MENEVKHDKRTFKNNNCDAINCGRNALRSLVNDYVCGTWHIQHAHIYESPRKRMVKRFRPTSNILTIKYHLNIPKEANNLVQVAGQCPVDIRFSLIHIHFLWITFALLYYNIFPFAAPRSITIILPYSILNISSSVHVYFSFRIISIHSVGILFSVLWFGCSDDAFSLEWQTLLSIFNK